MINLVGWPASAQRFNMLLMMKIPFMASSVLRIVKNLRMLHRDFVRVLIFIILIGLPNTSPHGATVVLWHIAVHRTFLVTKSWLQNCMMSLPRKERVVAALMHRGLALVVEYGDHLYRVVLEARIIRVHHRGLGCRQDYLYHRVDLDLASGKRDQTSECRLRINRREGHFGA